MKIKLLSLTIVIVIAGIKGYCSTKNAGDTSMITDLGDRIVLNNTIVSATIRKTDAHIISYKYNGIDVLKDGYYSMDGNSNYAQPKNCVFTIKVNTANLVDVVFTSKWKAGLRSQAVDIECHFVIEKGSSGVYSYVLLNHETSYPQTKLGEWRFVWKLPEDTFNHIIIDSLRNMDLPTSSDMARAQPTSIKESMKLTSGIKQGTYECKYAYNTEYYTNGTYGETNTKKQIGAWMVLGGYDFLNDGPTQSDLNAAYGGILVHFGRDHYAGSGTSIEAGEKWSKIFGPFLLYMNKDKNGSNAMWEDAKRKVNEEKTKWPYKWIINTDEYPSASERGNVVGKLMIKDPYKPNVQGGDAWIGLTEPGVDWEKDSKNYQYWVKTDANGKFKIANIRPGKYTLHAYTTGAVGEFYKEDIAVVSGEIKNIGNQVWTIPRNNGKLIWEIGIPDRKAGEYKYGKEYWNSFFWETYSTALANPLVYTVGKSDWSKDWNYAQSAYWNKDGSFSPWPWKINFKLDKLPATGEATLTFAFAAVDRAQLKTYINDDSKPFDDFKPTLNAGGNTLVRQGIHAKYSTYILKIPVSKLRLGNNCITLISNKGNSRYEHIMYDYISFELPE